MIHIVTPYREDKNLGRAYNEAFEICPDGDWLCLMDIDTMFLTPDAPRILQEYVNKYPDTGIFTSYVNRISLLAFEQIYPDDSENDSIRHWVELAKKQTQVEDDIYTIKRGEISGYLMLISKETWGKYPCPEFMEKGGCIGVDTWWSRAINRELPIRRMNKILVWHTYRILNGTKEHLL